MKELINKHAESIKSTITGFDNSIKCPKSKFMSIITDIDNNTSIEEHTIHNKFNSLNRTMGFYLLRKNKRSVAEWLQNNSVTILHTLYVYRALKNSVISVDDSIYDWYLKENIFSNIIIENEEFTSFIFHINNHLYFVEKFNDNIEISTITDVTSNNVEPGYNLVHDKDSDTLRVLCNNTQCPRWKNCLDKAYDDKSKYCGCSISDTQKCGYFNKFNIIGPLDAVSYAEAIVYCMKHRSYTESENKRDDDEYEHIPRPERIDDVVIYYGFNNPNNKSKNNNELFDIPASHASPREHDRRGGTRRGYYRKDGTWVRPTTFKATVVNKGHNKTNYKLKEKKGE